MDLQSIKNRFGIIGNSPSLNHALDTAVQVAATDLTVLIVGESGVGKEVFSQIIHALSARKHNPFIAVNCGAIPEGTIDSELFGHEKGAFTGAVDSRKGYFETVNGGTIFLDEIGEMPLGTQARLLRVLETGEFIRVGSSKVQKTDVRVIAATNRELIDYADKGKFRQDLYYRLSTVPIRVPSLRDRKEDIALLFRKFVVDFSERYKTTPVQLDEDAKNLLINYSFPGNVRELKNLAEQISVLSNTQIVTPQVLRRFLPEKIMNRMPVLATNNVPPAGDFSNEREILYKLFFDMKKDVTELKKMFLEILQNPSLAGHAASFTRESLLSDYPAVSPSEMHSALVPQQPVQPALIQPLGNVSGNPPVFITDSDIHHHEEIEESLNIMDKEKELIIKALKKHKSKRKDAAADLGISERTLYRKLKEYDIDDL
ncbi:MAG: sigma-54-dependent Fis family transcriptional regulator [Bacteroidota bacterium]|nr:sigma-54-dependent Fis family transcriptional regulator [Bacteroidota bacterium]